MTKQPNSPPKPQRRFRKMDTGWSYMVAVASFTSHALSATIYFAYSVLTPAWKEEFNATSGIASLVGCAAGVFSSGLG